MRQASSDIRRSRSRASGRIDERVAGNGPKPLEGKTIVLTGGLEALAPGTRIGTSSVRRRAQLLEPAHDDLLHVHRAPVEREQARAEARKLEHLVHEPQEPVRARGKRRGSRRTAQVKGPCRAGGLAVAGVTGAVGAADSG